jgi:hypothetical protein
MSAAPKWAPHLKLWKFKERRGAQTSINTVTLCRSQFAISRQKNSDLLFFTNRVRQYTIDNKQNGKSKPLVFTAALVIEVRSDLTTKILIRSEVNVMAPKSERIWIGFGLDLHISNPDRNSPDIHQSEMLKWISLHYSPTLRWIIALAYCIP